MQFNKIFITSLFGYLLLSTAHAATADNCFSGQLAVSDSSLWYVPATLTVTNQCNSAQNLNQVKVSFTSQSISQSPVTDLSSMWGGANSSQKFTYNGNKATTVLNVPNGNVAPKSWYLFQQMHLPRNKVYPYDFLSSLV